MKVDKDLLKLYSIYSVSRTDGEKEICDWISNKLTQLKIPFKRKGNTLYSLSNNTDMLLSAHLDQVATNGPAKHFYMECDRNIVGYNERYQRTSLGADDKNGVWLILKLLEQGYFIDFIISESEEVGCLGIEKMKKELEDKKKKYQCCIVLDRKNNKEILEGGSGGDYCKTLAHCLKNFLGAEHTVTRGSLSDTQTICKYIESVNMSVAYTSAHTKLETTDYKALLEILDNLKRIVMDFIHYPTDPKEYVKTVPNYSRFSGYYREGDLYDGWF